MSSDIIVFERQVLSLAIIEKELFQLYTEIAQKVEDVSAKTLLSYIATDSLKHSTILAAIFDEVNGSNARESDCDVNIRYNKQLIEALTKDISKTETINQGELIALIDTLCNFEELLYNEYKKSFHLEYNQVTTGYKSQKDEEPELNIFNLIVGDEERHQKILMSLVKHCDRKLSLKQDAPVVKYQSPDSWYVPPRG